LRLELNEERHGWKMIHPPSERPQLWRESVVVGVGAGDIVPRFWPDTPEGWRRAAEVLRFEPETIGALFNQAMNRAYAAACEGMERDYFTPRSAFASISVPTDALNAPLLPTPWWRRVLGRARYRLGRLRDAWRVLVGKGRVCRCEEWWD